MDTEGFPSDISDLPLSNPNTAVPNIRNVVDLQTICAADENFISILDISNSKQGGHTTKYEAVESFVDPEPDSRPYAGGQLSERCRICLDQLTNIDFVGVFESKMIGSLSFKFNEMIALITSVEIRNNDLSTRICRQCLSDLDHAFDFRQKAISSNNVFTKVVEKNFGSDDKKMKIELDDDYEQLLLVKRSEEPEPIETVKIETYSDTEDDCNDDEEEEELEDEGSSETEEDSENEDQHSRNDESGDDPLSEKSLPPDDESPLTHESPSCTDHLPELRPSTSTAKSKPKKKKRKENHKNVEESDSDDNEEPSSSSKSGRKCEGPGRGERVDRECPICHTVFTAWKKFLAHIDWHIVTYNNVEGELRFRSRAIECEICNHRFDNKALCKNHMLEVHGINLKLKKGHLCEFCGKETKKLANHKMHLMTHTGELPFSCDDCNKKFALPCYLKYHKERKHSNNGSGRKRREYGVKRYICDTCNKTYTNRYSLNVHVRREHTKEGGFRCEFCDKVFYVRNKLKDHVAAVHSNAKPFQCNLCDKVFAIKTYLTLHMYKHTQTKDYMCDKCDYKASQQSNLQRHIFVVHEGGHSFPCDQCGKKFTSKRSCERHSLIHRGIKPYSKYTPLEDLPL